MDDYRRLSDVLSEFARTILTDFPIQGILDHLVIRIVDLLPVSAAGVTLISAELEPRHVAASDSSALQFEQLQTDLREGPCIEAFTTGEPVHMPDLSVDNRFPAFTSHALTHGLRAVFTFPLRHGDAQLGALDLYRAVAGPMSPTDVVAAQSLADVVSAYLLNAQARDELKVSLERTRHISIHDPLTGLANRNLFVELLTHAIARSRRSLTTTAVMFVDLDNFKTVNDTYGHHVGDDALRAVAQRLSVVVRPGDTIARFGGDEFVVLCEDLTDTAAAAPIAQRLSAALAEPFELGDTAVRISGSIGIAFVRDSTVVAEQVLQDADAAMYQAKRRGGACYVMLDVQERNAANLVASTERELLGALDRGEFRCAYQPIVATADRRIIGAEALLRWERPGHGTVSPSVVIPMAERSGQIQKIGQWVLEQGCVDRRSWHDDHSSSRLELSVNVSAHQLLAPGYVITVEQTLASTATDPTLITLELTESVLVYDSSRALIVLGDLKRLGVKIALDDFGTGFSSLSYLKNFPVDSVKIDQTFIADLAHNTMSYLIVEAIVSVAHNAGLSVTAEGVETADQHAAVLAVGCDSYQGFSFAKPSAARVIADLIRTQ